VIPEDKKLSSTSSDSVSNGNTDKAELASPNKTTILLLLLELSDLMTELLVKYHAVQNDSIAKTKIVTTVTITPIADPAPL